jgi:hypothetical protein
MAFPQKQWLDEPSSKLRYNYIACILRFKQSMDPNFILLIWSWTCVTCVPEYYYFSGTSWSLKKEEVYSIETSDINKQDTKQSSTDDMYPHFPSLSGKENRKPRSDSVSWLTANIATDITSAVFQQQIDCYSLNQYVRLLCFPVTSFRFNISFCVFLMSDLFEWDVFEMAAPIQSPAKCGNLDQTKQFYHCQTSTTHR